MHDLGSKKPSKRSGIGVLRIGVHGSVVRNSRRWLWFRHPDARNSASFSAGPTRTLARTNRILQLLLSFPDSSFGAAHHSPTPSSPLRIALDRRTPYGIGNPLLSWLSIAKHPRSLTENLGRFGTPLASRTTRPSAFWQAPATDFAARLRLFASTNP